jgi:hypothetical protein
MSSSRSIAAARNRRAGEQQPTQRPRPNTSIASQSAFAQQQMQQQPNQQNRRVIGQQQQQVNAPKQPVPVNKISISDAIGLITIRLGRIEQYVQMLQEEGGIPSSSSLSENMQLVDKEVIQSITTRMNAIETKQQQQIKPNLENEVKEIKELLKNHIAQFQQFASDTEQKILDIDCAFAEMEKNFEQSSDSQPAVTDSENIQLEINDKEEEEIAAPTFSSIDLKNMISQELANAEI